MKILLDYTLHNREVIEVSDEEWEFLGPGNALREDTIIDIYLTPLGKSMGYPIVKEEFSILDVEAFEPLSD